MIRVQCHRSSAHTHAHTLRPFACKPLIFLKPPSAGVFEWFPDRKATSSDSYLDKCCLLRLLRRRRRQAPSIDAWPCLPISSDAPHEAKQGMLTWPLFTQLLIDPPLSPLCSPKPARLTRTWRSRQANREPCISVHSSTQPATRS